VVAKWLKKFNQAQTDEKTGTPSKGVRQAVVVVAPKVHFPAFHRLCLNEKDQTPMEISLLGRFPVRQQPPTRVLQVGHKTSKKITCPYP
jgi:hypothetical protein